MRTQNTLIAGAVIALAFSGAVNAQTTSYKNNTTPISCWGCTGFGQNALSSNSSGVFNSATGIETLRDNTSGHRNTATGYSALDNNTTGAYNTATGCDALSSNTTGEGNTATGYAALKVSTGTWNTATGSEALANNTSGGNNVATGVRALFSNTNGYDNSATGSYALSSNISGFDNSAIGSYALYSNTTGYRNTAIGSYALRSNTIGSNNVATGYQTLFKNNTGELNVATGYRSLYSNTSGSRNIASGTNTLYYSTTGSDNVAIGSATMYSNTTGYNNVAAGYQALYSNTIGYCNTGIGYYANVSTGNLYNATAIGCGAVVNANNTLMLGQLGTTIKGASPYMDVSDGRFKSNIKEEDVKGLEFITKLRPVVYNFDTRKLTEFLTQNMPDSIRKTYLDRDFTASTNIRQSGFIAQEVEKTAKDVGYDFNGVHVPENENDNYSLAYSQFVVPLVKAVQEQQQMIEALQQQIDALQKGRDNTTGINDGLSVIGASMEQNVPNPFSRETEIRFNLPQQISNAFMTVYDLSGREIKTLPIHQRGASSITVTAEQLEAGMYIYSITADGKIVDSKRMVVAGK